MESTIRTAPYEPLTRNLKCASCGLNINGCNGHIVTFTTVSPLFYFSYNPKYKKLKK